MTVKIIEKIKNIIITIQIIFRSSYHILHTSLGPLSHYSIPFRKLNFIFNPQKGSNDMAMLGRIKDNMSVKVYKRGRGVGSHITLGIYLPLKV